MNKTSLFEEKFKGLFKSVKKRDEDENSIGGGALGPAAAVGHSELGATDWYAPGDYRRPNALGATYSRKGIVGKNKNKTKNRKRKK